MGNTPRLTRSRALSYTEDLPCLHPFLLEAPRASSPDDSVWPSLSHLLLCGLGLESEHFGISVMSVDVAGTVSWMSRLRLGETRGPK